MEPELLEIEKRLEAVLFLETKGPVPKAALCRQIACDAEELQGAAERLNDRLLETGSVLHVRELDEGLQLALRPEWNDPVLDGYRDSGKRRLTRALLETLVIIAYRQPITRAEVEGVRGVNSAIYIKQLLDDGFLRVAGRRVAPGKPVLYCTTAQFLLHFGMKSLKDLPSPKEFRTFDFLQEGEENESFEPARADEEIEPLEPDPAGADPRAD